MSQDRMLEENHGDYVFSVVKREKGSVICQRALIDAPKSASKPERIPSAELPSESLKDRFAEYSGKSRAELML